MYRVFFVIALSIMISSCSDELGSGQPMGTDGMGGADGSETSGTTTMDTMTMDPTSSTGKEQYLDLDSDYIFDQGRLPTFELILPPSHLEDIDSDPAAEEYTTGALVFEGDTINPVGIRYKGSIGAFVGCLSGNDWANPSGRKTCTKLSMKIKFNWEGREEHFYGLKKLQFHSMNNDDSQMRERLGYHLFRAMGAPAPRCVHARLIINGEYVGLFALIEQIDGRFTRYNYEDGKGNLYKEVWPNTNDGETTSDGVILAGLKTNEDENPSLDIIRSFGQALEDANDSNIKAVLNQYLDTEEALSYFVVDRMIRHDDGPMHWYCNGSLCTNHNYYWYEEPINQKMHLVAWDLDNSFENIINEANPVTPVPDEWGETRNDCEPYSYGWFGLRQWSASCDKLTGGLANNYVNEYEALRNKFKEGPFSEAEINSLIMTWSAQIEDATAEARLSHNDAVSLNRWDSAVDDLLKQIDFSRNK